MPLSEASSLTHTSTIIFTVQGVGQRGGAEGWEQVILQVDACPLCIMWCVFVCVCMRVGVYVMCVCVCVYVCLCVCSADA